jgi:hypothetical protein
VPRAAPPGRAPFVRTRCGRRRVHRPEGGRNRRELDESEGSTGEAPGSRRWDAARGSLVAAAVLLLGLWFENDIAARTFQSAESLKFEATRLEAEFTGPATAASPGIATAPCVAWARCARTMSS